MNTNRKCEMCEKAAGIVFKKKMMPDPMDSSRKVLLDVLCCADCANKGRQIERKWGECKACKSATLAHYLNPERGLCKVCEEKAITDEVRPEDVAEFNEIVNDHRNKKHERDVRESMAVDFNDGEPRDLALTPKERQRIAKDKAHKTEQERLAKSQDPAQFLMNKARQSIGMDLRDCKAEYTPATDKQLNALATLGHDKDMLPKMKLTVSEASRLLQKGPKWLWPTKVTVKEID
jgi:hypothetical protein